MTTNETFYILEQAWLTPNEYNEDDTVDEVAEIKSRLNEIESMIIEAEENGDYDLIEELEEEYAELEDCLY